jgi:hypothetical protein
LASMDPHAQKDRRVVGAGFAGWGSRRRSPKGRRDRQTVHCPQDETPEVHRPLGVCWLRVVGYSRTSSPLGLSHQVGKGSVGPSRSRRLAIAKRRRPIRTGRREVEESLNIVGLKQNCQAMARRHKSAQNGTFFPTSMTHCSVLPLPRVTRSATRNRTRWRWTTLKFP